MSQALSRQEVPAGQPRDGLDAQRHTSSVLISGGNDGKTTPGQKSRRVSSTYPLSGGVKSQASTPPRTRHESPAQLSGEGLPGAHASHPDGQQLEEALAHNGKALMMHQRYSLPEEEMRQRVRLAGASLPSKPVAVPAAPPRQATRDAFPLPKEGEEIDPRKECPVPL